jgi:hypothetical protein
VGTSGPANTIAPAPTPPPLTDGYKSNFEILVSAFQSGDAALVSAIDKSSGEPRALVCAMQRNEDGTITPVPFAVLVWGNPFEMFHDPTI